MTKSANISLTPIEHQHLIDTLENCFEEFEQLMMDREWFVTEIVDRIQTCLEILEKES